MVYCAVGYRGIFLDIEKDGGEMDLLACVGHRLGTLRYSKYADNSRCLHESAFYDFDLDIILPIGGSFSSDLICQVNQAKAMKPGYTVR